MSQGLDSYDNGTKRNWRGWQWNRLVEKLTVPVEEATALYLCGPDDFDRQKALDRGFQNENLIAVDVDGANVRRVRDRGGIAIRHDLNALIRCWPRDWPLDVIVADFCSGLDRTPMELLWALVFSNATTPRLDRHTAVAVNLQRGRDPWSNEWRDLLRHGAARGFLDVGDIDLTKHRGGQFVLIACDLLARAAMHKQPYVAYGDVFDVVLGSMAKTYNSYRSNRVYMDSVVLTWPGTLGLVGAGGVDYDPVAKRKIAAARAVRTMRARAA